MQSETATIAATQQLQLPHSRAVVFSDAVKLTAVATRFNCMQQPCSRFPNRDADMGPGASVLTSHM
jgi:hypothetical protein